MKLWLLRPIDEESGPWEPWYDKTFGFVVRAENEADARKMADENAGDENNYRRVHASGDGNPWLHTAFSSCKELLADGEAVVIIEDNHAS